MPASASPPGTPSSHGSSERKLVLLVDDDRDLLFAMQTALSRGSHGLSFITASSAEEALEILDLAEVSVIVSDFRLPGASGAALLAVARQRYPLLRGILMTGDPERGLATKAGHEGGVDRFFIKPVDASVLLRVCDQLARTPARPAIGIATPQPPAVGAQRPSLEGGEAGLSTRR